MRSSSNGGSLRNGISRYGLRRHAYLGGSDFPLCWRVYQSTPFGTGFLASYLMLVRLRVSSWHSFWIQPVVHGTMPRNTLNWEIMEELGGSQAGHYR
jgi:hypothetical protein